MLTENNVINRKMYKDIKKYDRNQMNQFCYNLYRQGFRDGAEAGDKADFKIKLIDILSRTKGIGDKTRDKILATLKE